MEDQIINYYLFVLIPGLKGEKNETRKISCAMSSTLSKVLWINLDRRADRARVQQKALEAAGAFTTGELFDAAVGCLIVTPRA